MLWAYFKQYNIFGLFMLMKYVEWALSRPGDGGDQAASLGD